MAAAAADEVEDLTSCSICFYPYGEEAHKPKYLSCHHTFCLDCIRVLHIIHFKLDLKFFFMFIGRLFPELEEECSHAPNAGRRQPVLLAKWKSLPPMPMLFT